MTPAAVAELETKVKEMYRAVAENPAGSYHFELGRALAERLGYSASALDAIPGASIESLVGVGYFFDLAALEEGDRVLDLGSGLDVFFAALLVGEGGRVVGIEMTTEQLDNAPRLGYRGGFRQVTFTKGYIEDLPFEDASFDVVISNGVINLAADKGKVFAEAARVLRPGAGSPSPPTPTSSRQTGPPALSIRHLSLMTPISPRVARPKCQDLQVCEGAVLPVVVLCRLERKPALRELSPSGSVPRVLVLRVNIGVRNGTRRGTAPR